jgi:uncharacterized membrane protein YecN with MAPEG domain
MVVTPLYAGLLAFWFLLLTLRVVQERHSAKVSLDDRGTPALQRRVRGHANFAEYVPLALLLLAILELSRFSLYLIHALGILLLLGRLLHGYAFAFRTDFPFGRFWGVLLTVVVLAIEAVLCLYQAYRGHLVWLTT